MPSATARSSVVSLTGIEVANVPSAFVVRRFTTSFLVFADSSTGTPPRAGAMLPLTGTEPPPTSLLRARS